MVKSVPALPEKKPIPTCSALLGGMTHLEKREIDTRLPYHVACHASHWFRVCIRPSKGCIHTAKQSNVQAYAANGGLPSGVAEIHQQSLV